MNDFSNDIDSLTVRYMQGTCTEEEKKEFLRWLQADTENENHYFQMKEIFDTRHRMLKHENEDKGSRPSHYIPAGKHNTRFRVSQWMRYAAIFTILFGAALAYYLIERTPSKESTVFVKQIVVHNTRGVYQLTLPDSSRVWLHGGTTLTYPEHFTDSLRKVDLQGEAYFAVHADVAHPFVVNTSTARIRATGTEFNVTAYPDDQMTTTTLVKGKVNVKPIHAKNTIDLKPNQQALVAERNVEVRTAEKGNTTKEVVGKKEAPVLVQNIDAELFTDWKDGVYRFKNEPFKNITLRLEKMYGVDIRIENRELQAASFSGMFTADYSMKEVFDIINISNPIVYHIEDKVVYIKNKKIR